VPTLHVRDDMGRDLHFGRAPERIVSLVPSDTYSLFALGAGDRVVGRTAWCEAPAEAAGVPTVGGTKDVDVEAVLALEPDLVVANQEENARPALEALADRRVPLLVSLPRRAADGIAHLARLARILRAERAEIVKRAYHQLKEPAPDADLAVFVPIWMDPLMTMNADTFGSDMLAVAGARNVFGDRLRLYPLAADLGKMEARAPGERDVRYPRIRPDEIAARAPEVILLPDEPHLFTAEDAAALGAHVPGARVVHCSGKDLFWYGAWQVDALPRLSAVIRSLGASLRGQPPAGDAG
jgi:ABC-type Fe3+-hydroxamate transport system substrate-binding protein